VAPGRGRRNSPNSNDRRAADALEWIIRAAPATPWTKRAMSSTAMLGANAKARLETIIPPSPSNTVLRTPNFAAIQPPGRAPTKVPAG
jgi:hypothetical protein